MAAVHTSFRVWKAAQVRLEIQSDRPPYFRKRNRLGAPWHSCCDFRLLGFARCGLVMPKPDQGKRLRQAVDRIERRAAIQRDTAFAKRLKGR